MWLWSVKVGMSAVIPVTSLENLLLVTDSYKVGRIHFYWQQNCPPKSSKSVFQRLDSLREVKRKEEGCSELRPVPCGVDYFNLCPASFECRNCQKTRWYSHLGNAVLLMHLNSQWNVAVDWLSRAACATNATVHLRLGYLNSEQHRCPVVIARSQITTGWWSIELWKAWKQPMSCKIYGL